MENTHLITIDIGGGRTELIKSSDPNGVDAMLALRKNPFIAMYVPMINVMVSTEGVRLDRTRMVIQKIKDNLQNIPDGYLRVGTLRVCEASPGFLATTEKRYNQENYRSSTSYSQSHGWNAYEVAPERQAGFVQDMNSGELPMPDRHVDRFMNYAAIICDMLKIYVDRVVIPREDGYDPRVFRFDKPDQALPNKEWINKLQLIRAESIEYTIKPEEARRAHEEESAKEREYINRIIEEMKRNLRSAEATSADMTSRIHKNMIAKMEPVREEYRARWMNRVVQDEIQEEEMAQQAERSREAACVLI